MNIIYIISILILGVLFVLIKKTDKKLDSINMVILTIITIFSYNAFICYVLTFFNIKSNLTTLSIINIIISTILVYRIIKTKEIQSFYYNKIDCIYIGIILVAVLGVSYANFGFPLHIKYESGDSEVHYLTSKRFAQNEKLLAKVEEPDVVYGNFQTRKIGSYVNSGIIMQCFKGIIDEFDFYKIFILFGIAVLFFTAWIMYSTMVQFSKSNITRFIALVLSIIYTMGYPLNSLLFGFEYLSMGILILGAIINMVYHYQNSQIKNIFSLIIFFLLNFTLFISYYMFVPFTYSALWIYFCINSYQNKNTIFCKQNIVFLTITLLLPFLFGYIYCLEQSVYNILGNEIDPSLIFKYSERVVTSSFKVDGYIYVNVYSNMLLLLPIPMYYLWKKWKENKFETLLLLFNIGYIILLLIAYKLEKVSMYYLSKNYFTLWLILFYINYKGLIYLYEKNKLYPIVTVSTYGIVVIENLILGYTPMENKVTNENENLTTVAEIFNVNKTILTQKPFDYYPEELEILRYARDNLDKSKAIEILCDPEQALWAYPMLEYVNDDKETRGDKKLLEKLLEFDRAIDNADYVIYMKNRIFYKFYEDKLFEKGEVIYSTNWGGIVKY